MCVCVSNIYVMKIMPETSTVTVNNGELYIQHTGFLKYKLLPVIIVSNTATLKQTNIKTDFVSVTNTTKINENKQNNKHTHDQIDFMYYLYVVLSINTNILSIQFMEYYG